jgi:hypothetical protein
MGSGMTATYRLVYFQPDPEDGERVCVALLFNTERDTELLYDPAFPKLKCLAPRTDSGLVRFYLEDLEAGVRRSPSDISSLIRHHSPQLTTSEARRSAWPLGEKARSYLMRRFLTREVGQTATLSVATVKDEKIDLVKEHIGDLLRKVSRRPSDDIREDANSQWVLGRNLPNIAPVAFAVRTSRVVILIDGVDLSVLSTKGALSRVNRVAHTFWQYGRVQQMGVDNTPPKRVGIVLNGTTSPGASYRDTHDFALHQFAKEADLAVDAASSDDFRKLEDALRE